MRLCSVIFVMLIPIKNVERKFIPISGNVKRKIVDFYRLTVVPSSSRSILSTCEFIWDCADELICCDFIFGKHCCLEPSTRIPIPIPIPVPLAL